MPLLLFRRLRRMTQLQDDSTDSDEHCGPPTASERVFNTYELLENILDHLPPTHLRRVRAVSKSWNELALRSQTLDATRKQGISQDPRSVQLLVFGAPHTGKKSLMCQWLCPHLCFGYNPIHEDAFRKNVTIDGENWVSEIVCINPAVWNLNAERTVLEIPSHAFAFVYSVTSRRSFDLVREMYEQATQFIAALYAENDAQQGRGFTFYEHRQSQKAVLRPVALIANKCDYDSLVNGWDVTRDEGVALAEEMGCEFYETSSMTHSSYGVDEALMGALRSYKDKRLEDLETMAVRKGQLKKKTTTTTTTTNTSSATTLESRISHGHPPSAQLSRRKRLQGVAAQLMIRGNRGGNGGTRKA